MSELVCLVEEDADGGYSARALGEGIFTQADTWDELAEAVRDAVKCHTGNHRNTVKMRRSLWRVRRVRAAPEA